MIAQLLYLQHVRQWSFYGSTFFIACTEIPPKGYFEHRNETLYVAVNGEGIHIIQSEKVVSNAFLASWPLFVCVRSFGCVTPLFAHCCVFIPP